MTKSSDGNFVQLPHNTLLDRMFSFEAKSFLIANSKSCAKVRQLQNSMVTTTDLYQGYWFVVQYVT